MTPRRLFGVLGGLALMAGAGGPAAATEPRSFVCEVLTAAGLGDAGELAPTPYARLLADGARIRFDEKSGRLLRELASGPLPVRRFVVVQRGTDDQDLVARLIGRAGRTATHDLLRIRLGVPAMPFLYVEGAVVATGICAEGAG